MMRGKARRPVSSDRALLEVEGSNRWMDGGGISLDSRLAEEGTKEVGPRLGC